MSEYLTLVFAALVVYLISAGQRLGHLSGMSLFVYAQAIMAVGIIPSLDPLSRADQTHALVIVGTFLVLTLTSVGYSFLFVTKTRKMYNPTVDFDYPRTSVWLLTIVSLGISVLYYASIGYIAFFESMQSIINGTGEDLANLRLQSYSGSRYLFPGYVNQFKNALLPALVLVIIVAAFRLKERHRILAAITLIPATLIVLLGTGQRAPFVRVLIFAVVALYLIAPKNMRRYAPRIALIGLPIFFLSTFATGRAATDLTQADGLGGTIGVFFEQLAFRIFGSSQIGATTGFRYIFNQNIATGSEWRESILGLLPGQAGSDIANQIFALLYGSTRGTAPLSLWGSVYYNFGTGGCLVIAAAIALLLSRMSKSTNALTRTNVIQLAGISGTYITMGLWISDGPTTPLNAGLVVYLFLWVWGGRIARRRPSTPTLEPSRVVSTQ